MNFVFLFLILSLVSTIVTSLVVNDYVDFPNDYVIAKKEMKLYREFLFVSGDGEFIEVILYNGTAWNYGYRIDAPTEVTVTEFGLDLDVNNDILVVACTVIEGAAAFVYKKDGLNWVYDARIDVSADHNLVVYPPNKNNVISLRSNYEFVAFTIDSQFNAAFIKIFTFNDDTNRWDLKNIFSPRTKYSVQNRDGSICWTDEYMYVSLLKGLDKNEVYGIDENYEETFVKEYIDYAVDTEHLRSFDCFGSNFVVGVPGFNNPEHSPNVDTGKVKFYNVDVPGVEPIYNIMMSNDTQFQKCNFGSDVSMDSTSVVVGSVEDSVSQIRSVDVYHYTQSGVVHDYRITNEDYVSMYSDIPMLIDVDQGVVSVNMNFFTGRVGNLTVLHDEGHTLVPTKAPTGRPTTMFPTRTPTTRPTTEAPTEIPTTLSPTPRPTVRPTLQPTSTPPTYAPTTKFPKPQKHISIWIVFSSTLVGMIVLDYFIDRVLVYTKDKKDSVGDVKKKVDEDIRHDTENGEDDGEEDVFLKRSIKSATTNI